MLAVVEGGGQHRAAGSHRSRGCRKRSFPIHLSDGFGSSSIERAWGLSEGCTIRIDECAGRGEPGVAGDMAHIVLTAPDGEGHPEFVIEQAGEGAGTCSHVVAELLDRGGGEVCFDDLLHASQARSRRNGSIAERSGAVSRRSVSTCTSRRSAAATASPARACRAGSEVRTAPAVVVPAGLLVRHPAWRACRAYVLGLPGDHVVYGDARRRRRTGIPPPPAGRRRGATSAPSRMLCSPWRARPRAGTSRITSLPTPVRGEGRRCAHSSCPSCAIAQMQTGSRSTRRPLTNASAAVRGRAAGPRRRRPRKTSRPDDA